MAQPGDGLAPLLEALHTQPQPPGVHTARSGPHAHRVGRQDRIVPLACGAMYHAVLQGSTLHIIDQGGHAPQREQRQEFVEVTVQFLSTR